MPAKVNYEMALNRATDGMVTELRRRIDICKKFLERYPE